MTERPVVVAFVYNPATHDVRVLKEAQTLAEAGYDVTLVGTWRDGLPREERRGAVRILRIPVRPIDARLLDAVGSLYRLDAWRSRVRALRRWLRGGGGGPAARGRRRWLRLIVLVALSPLIVVGGALYLLYLVARAADWLSGGLPGRLAGGLLAAVARLRRAVGRVARDAVSTTIRFPLVQRAWYRGARALVPHAAVYHGHDLTALPVAARFRRERGGRLVYDSHELYLESGRMVRLGRLRRWAWTRHERGLVARCDAVVTVNEGIAAELERRYPLPSPPVVVMNCPPRWHPERVEPPARDRFRERLPIGPERRILLYQGGFSAHRGLEQIAEALLDPALASAVAVYLGYGPLKAGLEALAVREPYRGRLFVVDAVPPEELLEWTASADVSLIPLQRSTLNHWLNSPNKLFESLAAGVPVVASRFPVIERIVTEWGAGELLDDPTDPAALAAAIGRILALPPDAYAELRRRCRRAALERFNWETEGARLVELYERLAPRDGAA